MGVKLIVQSQNTAGLIIMVITLTEVTCMNKEYKSLRPSKFLRSITTNRVNVK